MSARVWVKRCSSIFPGSPNVCVFDEVILPTYQRVLRNTSKNLRLPYINYYFSSVGISFNETYIKISECHFLRIRIQGGITIRFWRGLSKGHRLFTKILAKHDAPCGGNCCLPLAYGINSSHYGCDCQRPDHTQKDPPEKLGAFPCRSPNAGHLVYGF